MNLDHTNATTVSCLKRMQDNSPLETFDYHMMFDHVNSAPTTIVKFKKPKNIVNVVTAVKPVNKITFKKPLLTAVVRAETNIKKAKKSGQEEKKGFKLGFVNSRGELVCRLCGTNCVTMKLFSRYRSKCYSYEELETIIASSKMCNRRRDNEVIDVDQLEDHDEDVLEAARILMFMTGDHRSKEGSSLRVEGLKDSVDVGCKRVLDFDLNVVAVDVEEDNELMIQV